MIVLAIYDKYLFKCFKSEKMTSRLSNIKVEYLQRVDLELINRLIRKLRSEYPNVSIQIFRDIKKPLLKELREAIEIFMSHDENFLIMMRDDKLETLLE